MLRSLANSRLFLRQYREVSTASSRFSVSGSPSITTSNEPVGKETGRTVNNDQGI